MLRLDLFLMFQAWRKPAPLPKPAERIVNALTDSIQPLVDVPRNVVAFARKQIRQYHGVQELVIAFYEALAEGRRPAGHRRRRDLRRCAGPRRWRARPTATTRRGSQASRCRRGCRTW